MIKYSFEIAKLEIFPSFWSGTGNKIDSLPSTADSVSLKNKHDIIKKFILYK